MKIWPFLARPAFAGFVVAALALSGPARAAVPPSAPDAPMPRPEEILAVPPALRDALLRQAGDGGTEAMRLERLVGFLFGADGLGMSYASDATSTVGEAYRTRRANCLTFTLMTVALARELGLVAYGQEIEEVLSWYQEGGIIYRGNHVNAGVRIGTRRFTVDVASTSVIVRHPPEAVDDAHLLAQFYNNRAVELNAQDRREAAATAMALSLQLAPAYAVSRSNAGVLALGRGDAAAAEHDYLAALGMDPDSAPALFNLVSLYQRRGEHSRAQPYRKRLDRLQRRDPFHHFLAAEEHERRGEYALAAARYRKAIRLHGSEPLFHAALARVHLHLGNSRRAGRALRRARQLEGDRSRAKYQARLDLFERPR
jgi:tetratricopeptide (TPR) repeat protein